MSQAAIQDLLATGAFDAFTQDEGGSEELKAAFEGADTNGDGSMDIDEFVAFMDEYGIDAEWAEQLFTAFDTDESGGVDFHEMVSVFVLANQPVAEPAVTYGATDRATGKFVDAEFPADETVVFGDECDPTNGEPVCWMRAPEVVPGAISLFEGIEPTDVCQGGLGDCWLLAAISALAEFPGAIESLFVTNRIAPDGKYTIKLWECIPDSKPSLVEVIIDDQLAVMDAELMYGPGYTFGGDPPQRYKPCFTAPQGKEIWVPLLEKAVAKFCGSFSNLNGGQALYAWMIFTGCTELYEYRKQEDETWQHVGVQYTDPRSVDSWSGYGGPDGVLEADAFWTKLCEFDASNFVMGASCSGGVEDQLDTGLVTGHAYSMLTCKEVNADGQTFKMICLRNPWGNDKEWNGAFSDTWDGWGEYPGLASKLGVSGKAADGKFWMCWEDFLANWDAVSVAAKKMDCIRGTNNTTRGITMKARNKTWQAVTCGGQCSIM